MFGTSNHSQEKLLDQSSPVSPIIDWSKVHRHAYIKALATAKARDLQRHARRGQPVAHMFGNMLSPSYSYSYFSKEIKNKKSGLQAILGKTRLYDYYPKIGATKA